MAMPSTHNTPTTPRTVEDISRDYRARRAALVRALTRDVDQVYESCDPDDNDLCLYGHSNERWEVTLPSKMVPPRIPDPTVGINYARDLIKRSDWHYMVAIHSDSWLYNVAFFYAAYLNANEKMCLFNSINSLPTVFEVVSEWNSVQNTPNKGKSSEASGSKSKGKSMEVSGSKSKDKSSEASGRKSRIHQKRSSDGPSKSTSNIAEESHGESEEEREETRCGSCGKLYYEDEFWIACDFCLLWYHGECVNITSEMAENIGKYECPVCAKKRIKA